MFRVGSVQLSCPYPGFVLRQAADLFVQVLVRNCRLAHPRKSLGDSFGGPNMVAAPLASV